MAYKRARYSRLDRAVDLIGMIGIIVPIALAFLAGRQDLMMQQLPVSISMGVLFAIYQIAE